MSLYKGDEVEFNSQGLSTLSFIHQRRTDGVFWDYIQTFLHQKISIYGAVTMLIKCLN